MKKMMLFAMAAMCLVQAACVKHIGSYTPKRREYQLPVSGVQEAAAPEKGSLWSASGAANYLFSDQRALMVNDVVVVRIQEESSAFSDATTKLDSEARTRVGIDALAGLMQVLKNAYPEFDPSNIVKGGRENEFAGSGATSRRGKLQAMVPAVVRQVFPNGNLFIEGHRVILVNDEEYHFYISGMVRAIDIDESNSVDSTRIADAEIEFTGRGTVTEKQNPGWLSRGLDWIWPF
jgi:flagellar L-ring protein precursor FlgH